MDSEKLYTSIYFRLPRSLDRKLRSLAQQEERTLAAQLRYLIRQAVEEQRRQPAATIDLPAAA